MVPTVTLNSETVKEVFSSQTLTLVSIKVALRVLADFQLLLQKAIVFPSSRITYAQICWVTIQLRRFTCETTPSEQYLVSYLSLVQ